MESLWRYKFSDSRVVVEDERPYGSTENEKSIITGCVTDHAMSYVLSGLPGSGLCLGIWEDKCFLKNILNQKDISQVCAAVLGEEKMYTLGGRILNEFCGILTKLI